ncbi:MAG: hypothetical protein COA63_001450 [Methylophaga sp.]|nr:hypothetical protein [Methylophaga sp.]
MKLTKLLNSLGTARTEQQNFSYSVYQKFVVPPALAQYDLREMGHSIILQGSRGCGKTTFIRYFSHWTQFDKKRSSLESDSVRSVILYWKPDTAFFRSISYGWLQEDKAFQFFMVIAGLEIFEELISAIDNMSYHWPEIINELDNSTDFWPSIELITGHSNRNISSQLQWVKKQLYITETAIQGPDTSKLTSISPSAVLKLLVPILQKECSRLNNVRFSIYVDEFENLSEQQQKIINGYRKGSDATLTWNVAHKRFAKIVNKTDGIEQITETDDFRNLYMEEIYGAEKKSESHEGIYDYDVNSKVFTSEVFLHGLLSEKIVSDIDGLSCEMLTDLAHIEYRQQKKYQDRILKLMRNIFPEPQVPELLKTAMQQKGVKNLVEKQLLKNKIIPTETIKEFIKERPSDAFVSWCISQQKTFKPEQLLAFINNDDAAFKERVRTYSMAALLSMNIRFDYVEIPIYSGFDRFIILSQSNIRHFIELCYQSLSQLDADIEVESLNNIPSVSYQQMYQGAIETSKSFLGKINSFEPLGQKLSLLVSRLGILFQSYQRQDVQSEPEKVSIVVKSVYGEFPYEIDDLLESAKCWRVLIQDNITRDRSAKTVVSSSSQFGLSPICSPGLKISYRKGRTIQLTLKEFTDLCFADNVTFQKWLDDHIKSERKSVDQGALF